MELHEAVPVFVKTQVNVALQAQHVSECPTVSVLASLAVRSPVVPPVIQADIKLPDNDMTCLIFATSFDLFLPT